jgi:eukaryotic-like serine/threonine-protein kinase
MTSSRRDVVSALQVGTLVAGKYRIADEGVLGTGGMGTVVAATDVQVGRKVALKFLKPEASGSDEAVARFVREARAAACLRSEHAVRIIEAGTDGGVPFIAMERLEGADLGRFTAARGGSLPPSEAVGYLLQAAEALAEAHAQGIVHRDLTPANLFVARRPDGTPLVKVLDFGISKLSAEATSISLRLTRATVLVGTPAYMAPEQMVGAADVDGRADIWSLGVILYELLSGKPPFQAPSFIELCLKVTNEPHLPLARARAGLPPGLCAVVERCLMKAPARRFPDITALTTALAHHGPDAAAPSAPRMRRRRTALVLTVATAVALAGIALVTMNQPPPATATATATAAPPPAASPAPVPPPAPPPPAAAETTPPAAKPAKRRRARATVRRSAPPPAPAPVVAPGNHGPIVTDI